MEYYEPEVLHKIAKMVGHPIKMDINTALANRAKYARICVEVDLELPLLPEFELRGKSYAIEYEYIYSICFNCGKVGHRKEWCPRAKLASANVKATETATMETNVEATRREDVNVEEGATFGPWNLVTRRNKKGPSPKGNIPNQTFNSNRFGALSIMQEKGGMDQPIRQKPRSKPNTPRISSTVKGKEKRPNPAAEWDGAL